MPLIGTDDSARRLTFIWKGPVEMPLPFDARGQAWGFAIVLVPAGWIAAWALLSPLDLVPLPATVMSLLHLVAAVAAGTVGAIWLIRKVGSHVDPTRPVRHHKATLLAELHAARFANEETTSLTVVDDLWTADREDTQFLQWGN